MSTKTKIKTKTEYTTTDGCTFDVKKDAIEHQALIDFAEWYRRTGNDLLVESFEGLTTQYVADWLRLNKDEILKLLV